MKLTFLGTSAGKPTKERNVSALALEFDQDNKWYLFDCGEGTQRQIMQSRLHTGKLDAIFITHLHGDHYYGLPGLLSTKKLDMVINPLTIYGPKGIKKFLECTVDVSEDNLGYILNIIEYTNEEEFKFDKFSLKILPLVHSKDSSAFYIKENDISDKLDEEKLRKLGLEPSSIYGELKRGKSITFQDKKLDPKEFMMDTILGRSLIIAGDNSKPDILDKYLENLDLLIHECSYTQEVYDNLAKKVMHTTAKDLGITAQKKSIKNLIVNHINPRYNKNSTLDVDIVYNEIKSNYDGKLFIANDFDVYYLSRDKSINKNIEFHPFKPIIFPDSEILILGSFPSIKSFEYEFYYAHPRNQFWSLLGEVFGEDISTRQAKIALCKKHKIALWDCVKSLNREVGNSSDSNLKDIEVNDFNQLLQDYPYIDTILFTGKKAEAIFSKIYKELHIKKALLPSPSPAYASMSFEKKMQKYKELLKR